MLCHRDRRTTKPVARRPLRPSGYDGMGPAAALPLYPDNARWKASTSSPRLASSPMALVTRPYRPPPRAASHSVTAYMRSQGYRIIPVNPNETEVLGERSYSRLQDIPAPVEIVNVFRRSEYIPEVVEDAISVGAKVVWLQEGVVHEEAAGRAREAGLEVVMDLCILKEHMSK